MKRFLSIILTVCFLLAGTGCTSSPPSDQDPDRPSIDVPQALHLSETQAYDLYDYNGDTLLFSVYDTSKRAPGEPETAQANAAYVEKFVCYDTAAQTVTAEYPVAQFGFIHSALLYAGGALFSFYSSGSAAIQYADAEGMQRVCSAAFTPYDLGPLLFRCGDAALFSYWNDSDGSFGLQQIDPQLKAEPLLTFHAGDADYISDDYRTSASHYAYTVGEDDRVAFYIGSVGADPVRVCLPAGEKINSFALTEDTLILCKEAPASNDGTYFLEKLNFEGQSLELYRLDEPLVRMRAGGSGQICAFGMSAPFALYETQPRFRPVEKADMDIGSTLLSCLSNGENFVIYSLDPSCQTLWMLI